MGEIFDRKAKYHSNVTRKRGKLFSLNFKKTFSFSGYFKQGDLSEALTEIVKYDPKFDVQRFLQFFENEIVPNIMEAVRAYDKEILKDWCSERVGIIAGA